MEHEHEHNLDDDKAVEVMHHGADSQVEAAPHSTLVVFVGPLSLSVDENTSFCSNNKIQAYSKMVHCAEIMIYYPRHIFECFP